MHINDLLVPEGSNLTCEYRKRGVGYYDTTVICSEPALVRLPTKGINTFCYAHAMETLRADLAASKRRGRYWDDANKRSPTWGGSIASMNTSSDIRTINSIMRILEEYATQQMRRR